MGGRGRLGSWKVSEGIGRHRKVSKDIGRHRKPSKDIGSHWKPPEANKSHQKSPEAIGSHWKAIKSQQKPSEAFGSHRKVLSGRTVLRRRARRGGFPRRLAPARSHGRRNHRRVVTPIRLVRDRISAPNHGHVAVGEAGGLTRTRRRRLAREVGRRLRGGDQGRSGEIGGIGGGRTPTARSHARREAGKISAKWGRVRVRVGVGVGCVGALCLSHTHLHVGRLRCEDGARARDGAFGRSVRREESARRRVGRGRRLAVRGRSWKVREESRRRPRKAVGGWWHGTWWYGDGGKGASDGVMCVGSRSVGGVKTGACGAGVCGAGGGRSARRASPGGGVGARYGAYAQPGWRGGGGLKGASDDGIRVLGVRE